VSLCGFSALAE